MKKYPMLYRFGFENFRKKPIQLVITVLLLLASMAAMSFTVLLESFSYRDFAKACYYKTEVPIAYSSYCRYTNFVFVTNYSQQSVSIDYSQAAKEEVKRELSKIGLGYAMYSRQYAGRHGVNGKWSDDCLYSGSYRIDRLIANDTHRISYYDEAGNLAPYIPLDMNYPYYYADMYGTLACFYDMDEASLGAYGYTLYGRFPENRYEVMVPQCIYNAFAAYGYRDPDTGERLAIGDYADLIGKKLSMHDTPDTYYWAEIVGVLGVDYEAENWRYYWRSYDDGLHDIRCGYYSPIFSIIVSEEYFDARHLEQEDQSCFITLKDPGERIRDAYFELGTRWKRGLPFVQSQLSYPKGSPRLELRLSTWTHPIRSAMANLAKDCVPFMIFTYCLIPLTVGLIGYLGYALVERSQKQLWILRSLGAPRGKVLAAYLLPIGVLMLLCAGIGGGIGYAVLSRIVTQELQYSSSLFGVPISMTLQRSAFLLPLVLLCVIGLSLAACGFAILRRQKRLNAPRRKEKK